FNRIMWKLILTIGVFLAMAWIPSVSSFNINHPIGTFGGGGLFPGQIVPLGSLVGRPVPLNPDLVNFPDAHNLMLKLDIFERRFDEFHKNVNMWRNDEAIIIFLKNLIQMLEDLKDLLKKISENIPAGNSLNLSIHKQKVSTEKLLKLMKSLLEQFQKINNTLTELRELFGSAKEILDTLDQLTHSQERPWIGPQEFSKSLSKALNCNCTSVERFKPFNELLILLKGLIEFKNFYLKRLPKIDPVYQVLNKDAGILKNMMKHIQSGVSISRVIKQTIKPGNQLKWTGIPSTVCLCGNNLTPSSFYCEHPKYKGCNCQSPLPQCI
ncbi:unnamed protein product, partial [Owenia fusiformis]